MILSPKPSFTIGLLAADANDALLLAHIALAVSMKILCGGASVLSYVSINIDII